MIDKDVKVYKQKGDTCAIACMMMVLEYYHRLEKANWYDEKRLFRIYGSKWISGTPFSALAYHFTKNGLETSLYHSEEHLFENKNNALTNEEFTLAMKEYKEFLKRAAENGAMVKTGVDLNAQFLKQKLEEGHLIILAGQISHQFHTILISGYEKDSFIVCDPLFKNKQRKTFQEIEKFMDTDIGKWCIIVKERS